MARLTEKNVSPSEVNSFLEAHGTSTVNGRVSFSELLKRPQITYEDLAEIDDETRPALSYHEVTQLEVQIKYEGYINKSLEQAQRMKNYELKNIPDNINYDLIDNIALEAREKLKKIQPKTIGQASRISGVN